MATIRKRGEKWHVQVRRKGCTAQTKSFNLRMDAVRWARQTEAEADRNGLTDRRALERVTVSELLTRFRDTVVPSRRGRAVETIVINAFLRTKLAQTRMSDLTPESFASYRDERLKTVKPGTINRELGLIQHIFEVARTDWNIPVPNPIKAMRKPKADRPRERRVSHDEWKLVLAASGRSRNPLFKPLACFAVETGMRRGELLNARWRDINWKDSTLHIPLTKNGEPRTIPLSMQAKAVLAGLAIDWWDDARIFPLTAESVKLGWKRLTKRAGVLDLHFHDLRHEAVSRFFERGLSVPEVALISGHKDPRMLFRYTHLRAEDVAKKLNSMVLGQLGQ
jgi:integrase